MKTSEQKAEEYFGGDRASTGEDTFDELVQLLDNHAAEATRKLGGEIVTLCNGDKQHEDADNNIMILDSMIRKLKDTVFDLRAELKAKG